MGNPNSPSLLPRMEGHAKQAKAKPDKMRLCRNHKQKPINKSG